MTALPVSLLIVAAILIVFPLQGLLPMDELILVSSEVVQRPWTLLTHMFLHGSLQHLVGNAFAFGLFGFILERVIGTRNFIWVFLIGGLVSSVGDIMFYSATLGISGALFGLIGALAVLRPRVGVLAFGVPLPMIVAAGLWILIDLSGFPYPDGIAHAAHLFGVGAGIVLGFYFRKYFPLPKEPKEPSPISEQEHRDWEEEYMLSR